MAPGSTTKGSRRRARAISSLVGGVLAVTGAVAVGTAVAGQDPAPPGGPREAQPSHAGSTPADSGQQRGSAHAGRDGPRASPPAMQWSRPVRVSIPRIGVTSGLEDLGLDAQGVMRTPQDPARAGWFTPGPAPGVAGAAVIAGHVTWDQQPAVFFRLGQMRRGDRVEVTRDDGTTAVFTVSRVAEFEKRSFPTGAVYGRTDRPELRLITCGGSYDSRSNSYAANLIVWADLTGSRLSTTR